MTIYKRFAFCILLLFVAGCALSRSTVAIHDVVLLPEERIFTIKEGTVIPLVLDGKEMNMSFPYPMKLAYESVLIRYEDEKNKEILKVAKAQKEKKQMAGIAGSVISALGAGLWIIARRKKLIKIEGNIKGEA